MNAYSYFARAFATRAPQSFLEADNGQVYTYADLERETGRIAAFLTGLGLRKGDRVAAQVEKFPLALFLYLGALRAGFCFLPLNTAYQRAELAYFLQDAEPRVVICRTQAAAKLAKLCAQAGVPHLYSLDEEGGGTLADALRGVPDGFEDPPLAGDDLAVIVYTSGTTGRSKGAMVTHGNLTSNAQVLKDLWRFTEHDVLLHALPIFHVHGLFVAVHTALLAGARMLFHRRFDTKAVIAALPRATVMMGVPTFYTRLLTDPDLKRDVVQHMRLFVSGSAPLLLDTFKEWQDRTGHTILERYGMSEAGMITSNPYEGERRGGTVGFPLPGVSVRVASVDGRVLGPGEAGEVQIRGPNVFAGYWRMPEKTKEEFTADQWFHTGDVGQWSSDGYLSIVGRAKDLIISGGYNVYPKEIELVIDALQGVLESAVIGVPDPDFGEAVTAVVVQHDDAALDETAVIAHVRSQIANYKVPKRVVFVKELPRNAMGKVQKNVLRDLCSEA
ncbi:MAG TPA: malonyl-CoA synthase [Burkholderiales bacterium]|jgi:malonyl-CoA/methylmalonyl-CoA synthetase|nr:malonyl-CoA synthase [Burkholderiales bacterium]